MIRGFAYLLGAILGCALIFFVLGITGIAFQSVFDPASANVQRNVYTHTNSYVGGMKQQLIRYMDQYRQAGPQGKKAVCSFVQEAYANFNENNADLTQQEKSFLVKCKYGN